MLVYAYYIVINVLSFMVFTLDKYKAIHHQRRISEAALFRFMLLGANIGSFLAMQLFHHKTKKAKFYVINLLSFLVHALLLYYFISF